MAKAANMTEETDKEVEDAEEPGASSRAKGGRVKRAKGGRIPGMKAKGNPGKRARGGGADTHPYTAAGNVSGGMGAGEASGGDKNTYHTKP